jgi:hypothetical protein
MKSLLKWDIYEIITDDDLIIGMKIRGRIRKFCIHNNQNILVENATDKKNVVRFAVISGDTIIDIKKYIGTIIKNVNVNLLSEKVANPILSKLKVNVENRYTL